jgi:hypothetical protein
VRKCKEMNETKVFLFFKKRNLIKWDKTNGLQS